MGAVDHWTSYYSANRVAYPSSRRSEQPFSPSMRHPLRPLLSNPNSSQLRVRAGDPESSIPAAMAPFEVGRTVSYFNISSGYYGSPTFPKTYIVIHETLGNVSYERGWLRLEDVRIADLPLTQSIRWWGCRFGMDRM
jgi:hypothetical protein